MSEKNPWEINAGHELFLKILGSSLFCLLLLMCRFLKCSITCLYSLLLFHIIYFIIYNVCFLTVISTKHKPTPHSSTDCIA